MVHALLRAADDLKNLHLKICVIEYICQTCRLSVVGYQFCVLLYAYIWLLYQVHPQITTTCAFKRIHLGAE